MGREGGTKTHSDTKLTPADVERLFGDGYRAVEILADGTVREKSRAGDATDELVTKTLKTGRTWY